MEYKGRNVYDNDDFFRQYMEKRNRGNSPNELLEKPVMDDLIGDIRGKSVLDIGCGSGQYGKELLGKGAASYHGIDGSAKMIALATSNLSGFDCTLEQISVEELKLSPDRYDLILSRLVFHYIENLKPVFKEIHQSLRSGGHFIFSIEHPIITSCYESYHEPNKKKRENWLVDHYFESGKRINRWIGKEVIKYHRTIEEYIRLIRITGFTMELLRESKPRVENFTNMEEYARRKRIPLFMLFKLKKTT